MKIIQIQSGFCFWDASSVVSSLEEAAERFAPNIVFVEAPDYVREGWGFDPDAEGDARFICPTAPEGWLYDDATGTLYREGGIKPSELKRTPEQLAKENIDLRAQLVAAEEQLTETQLVLCELYESMVGGANG